MKDKFDLLIEYESYERIDSAEMRNLEVLCKDEDSEIRYLVAGVLVNAPIAEAEALLLGMINDVDELVRTNVYDSLCCGVTGTTLHALMDKITSSDSGLVKSFAVMSFPWVIINGGFYKKQAVDFLKDHLHKEREVDLKICYWYSLCVLGDNVKTYYGLLLKQLNNRNYRTRCAVINRLLELVNESNVDITQIAVLLRLKTEKTWAVTCLLMELYEKIKKIQ